MGKDDLFYHYVTKKQVKLLEDPDEKQILRVHDSPLGRGVYFTNEAPDGKWSDMLAKMFDEEDGKTTKRVMYYAFTKKQLPGLKRKTKGIFAVPNHVPLVEGEFKLGCADDYAG
eukprot:TRINITY_DN3546_c0_g1_i2.p2 TRINITY_DN3546_c0_g1~~TRINITY_DN3546_c0_g1_i2.p2  ORF type:complete len:114 (+),score=63.51 TRINITY_DN3546_c0_g1_i2:69-410(+)